MREIYEEVAHRTSRGETVATATIIRTRGSTPREVGAKMLVTLNGISGTVGGGCGEAQAHQAALDAIADGRARVIEVDLTEQISYDARGVCGGVMEILVEPWSDPAAAEAIASALGASSRVGVVTLIDRAGGGIATRHHAVPPPGEPVDVEPIADLPPASLTAAVASGRPGLVAVTGEVEREVFVEVQVPPPTLFICGGGHIAVPLVSIGHLLGFRVVVVDDRPEFASAERFPEADEVIAEDFGLALKTRQLDSDASVVLVTRGHSHDVDCLLPIIERPLAYIGMIGSRRRVFAVYKLLHSMGVPSEHLRKLHAPIGIDIGAETPAEIAVAIAAELIRVRKGGGVPLLSDGIADRYIELVERGEELE